MATRLKVALAKRDWRIANLSRALNVDNSHIGRIVNRAIPASAELADAIADALGYKKSELFEETQGGRWKSKTVYWARDSE